MDCLPARVRRPRTAAVLWQRRATAPPPWSTLPCHDALHAPGPLLQHEDDKMRQDTLRLMLRLIVGGARGSWWWG